MKRPQLMIMTGDMAGKRFDVPEGGLRLGRSSSNDMPIPDEELSRNHCLFEQDGVDAIRIIDLASANGTFVNSEQLGADAKVLKIGDIIEAGRTVLKVVEEGTPAVITKVPDAPPPPPVVPPDATPSSSGTVDLGLDGGVRGADIVADATADWNKKSSLRVNILWCIVALLVMTAIALVLFIPSSGDNANIAASNVTAKDAASPAVTELRYEKIDADSTHIFRFVMEVDGEGWMHVTCVDVPREQRRIDKKKKLSDEDRAKISRIFADDEWRSLDKSYTGSTAIDENRLASWKICAIGGGRIQESEVVNMTEPAAFRRVREKLEALSLNDMSIWALQHSREELMEMANESERLGDSKWSERDVQHGNLAEAIHAYRAAQEHLDTFEPKPDGYRELCSKIERAEAELDRRYQDRRFAADRAINLKDWESARRELRTLLDIVTDTDDPRHTEAKARLVNVEGKIHSRAKKGGK